MPQNWWDMYPEIMPSPAAGPMPLPGPGGMMPGVGMGMPALPGAAAGAMPPSYGGFDPSALPGGFGGGKLLDRAPLKGRSSADQGMRITEPAAAVQLARDAIRNGADPKAVRARLSQLGSGGSNFDPSDPFSDLVPGARQRMMGDAWPAPMQAPAAFDDRAGFDARGQGASYAESGAEMPSQFLDPGFAHQKGDNLLRLSQETVTARGRSPTVLSTYGLPSYLPEDQSRTVNPRATAGELNRGVRTSAEQAGLPPKREPEHPNARARLRLANEAELNNPSVLAFLDTIAGAEGSDYHSLYGDVLGGRRLTFEDMLKHPGYVGRTRGRAHQSAAGRYQIQRPTYEGAIQRMGSLDMSPRSQDIMAVDVLRMSRALEALRANDFDTAVSNASGPWASLPQRVGGAWRGSRYRNQTAKSIERLRAAYNRALQYYSAPGPIPANNRTPLQIRIP